MLFRQLTTLLCLVSFVFQSVAFAASPKSFGRLDRENLAAAKLIQQKFEKIKSSQDFLREFGEDLTPKDKKYFLDATKTFNWGPIKRNGATLVFNGDIKVRFLNVNKRKLEVNGTALTLDLTAPLQIETELMQRKAGIKKNALLNLILPEAEALVPLAAAGVWVAINVAGRWVLKKIVMGAFTRQLAAGLVTAGAVTYLNHRINSSNSGPIETVVCMKQPNGNDKCENEMGIVVAKDVIDNPKSGYGIRYDITKCPDTTDPTFSFSVNSFTFVPPVPPETEPKRVPVKTKYVVKTEEKDGAVSLVGFTQETISAAMPEGTAPQLFTFSENQLQMVDYVAPSHRGAQDLKDFRLTKSQIDKITTEKTEGEPPTIEEDRWAAAKLSENFVRTRLATNCDPDTRKLFDPANSTLLNPLLGTPVTK